MTPREDPLDLFREWYAEAGRLDLGEPTAVALATASASGRPSARMVLLKGAEADGFVFYTNLESRKGQDLQENPQAALLFHWHPLRRQIRIEGPVEPVSAAEADAYFASRQRDSQIGAWASSQSRPLPGRFALEKEVAATAVRFGFAAVPRPPFWSGYRLRHTYLEFWNHGAFRLHDRLVYHRQEGGWRTEWLYP
ncbi:MAG: pyridoxamine 5'-phosphate oxidase [Alphaproteobacteria bacterium]|nr:pyridoxamine 5'-phosphate oxidase [Alphaproteobacteria bacterium]